MGKNAVLEAGLMLEAVARKIRRHAGEFSTLEFQIIRLHVETALSMLPNPPRPDVSAGANSDSAEPMAKAAGSADRLPGGRLRQ